VTFTPTSPGQYTFNYVVTDVAGNVTIDTVIVGSTFTADFDLDGDVDGADLDAWEAGYGTEPNAMVGDGDEDRDGDTDGTDFLAWQQQVGSTTAVPPSSMVTLSASSVSSEAGVGAAVESNGESSAQASAIGDSSVAVQSGWWIDAPVASDGDSDRETVSRDYDAAFDAWSSPVDGSATLTAPAPMAVADGEELSDLADEDSTEDAYGDFESELDEALAAWANG
jgi:hypothetical protein